MSDHDVNNDEAFHEIGKELVKASRISQTLMPDT